MADEVRRSARNVRARGLGRPVRSREVLVDLLSTRFAPLVRQGHIELPEVDVPALAERVNRLLEKESGSPGTGAAGRAEWFDLGRHGGSLPVVTMHELSRTDEDVRVAVRNVYDRAGRGGDPATADVVAEMIAARVASGPGKVGIDIGPAALDDFSAQIEKILPTVRPDSPWREAVGLVYSVDRVMRMLDIESPDDLAGRVAGREILGLHTSDGHLVFPACQFLHRRLLPGLTQVLAAFPADTELAWDVAAWLNTPLVMLDQRSIVDMLRAGDENAALQAATAISERWGE